MAKRYHQSKKDRMHESRGEKLHHERDRFNDEHHHDADGERAGSYHYDREKSHRDAEQYAGYKGRRHQEMSDAGMIHEDHHEIANLPQNVMIKPYPKTGPYMPEDLDDTLRGVDRQMDYDDSQRARHFYPKKV